VAARFLILGSKCRPVAQVQSTRLCIRGAPGRSNPAMREYLETVIGPMFGRHRSPLSFTGRALPGGRMKRLFILRHAQVRACMETLLRFGGVVVIAGTVLPPRWAGDS
jgi:hypothetical protein